MKTTSFSRQPLSSFAAEIRFDTITTIYMIEELKGPPVNAIEQVFRPVILFMLSNFWGRIESAF
jgi:hypothetical protein